jgi:hypothetical protein
MNRSINNKQTAPKSTLKQQIGAEVELVHKQATFWGMDHTGEASSPLRYGVACPNASFVIALGIALSADPVNANLPDRRYA